MWDLNSLGILDMTALDKKAVEGIRTSSQSSAGVLKKFSVQIGEASLFVKSGYSFGKLYSIREPVTECIVSEIGHKLGFNVVKYALWVISRDLLDSIEYTNPSDEDEEEELPAARTVNGRPSFQRFLMEQRMVLVSVCGSFISGNESFHSCAKIAPLLKNRKLYEALISSEKNRVHLDQMILMDYIVHNTDRHTKNFGFLFGEKIDPYMAPLYDHGLSLLSYYEDSLVEEYGMDLLTFDIGKPFGSLQACLDLVDPKSTHGINFAVTSDELIAIVDKYQDVLSEARITLIKKVIRRGWDHVRNKFSVLQENADR
ncbi:HipA domain-containing protein [Paenibacillus mesophilus]|uniref:HipA domain-containing protein n=1 Tax=Paenibacillus mesophilus TaxID=2582849 RepID=UPI00110DBEA2|nr:HipA domain-containing protein [Paenibacillus mesophilus]TMV43194.1 HipA domain-containing protein [Paenibacillus mesophilus]